MPQLMRRWLIHSGALALTLATLLTAADAPRSAHAACIVVNTLADAIPPATDGLCSLREAITNANNNAATWPDCVAGAGTDTITFSVSGTIVLVAVLPDITDAAALTIDGNGQSLTVSGNNAVRAFFVSASAELILTRITIRGAYASAAGTAVHNAGTLHIVHSLITENSCCSSPLMSGGPVVSTGLLRISSSVISSNRAENGGGAIRAEGGTVTIEQSQLIDNLSSVSHVEGLGGAGILLTGGGHAERN